MTTEWTTSLIQPLSENASGEDPRYHDDFIFIRQEIEKLSEANFDEVIRRGKILLTTTTKDLRVAAYMTLAQAVRQGIEGLLEGLQSCMLLLTHFSSTLYPQSVAARLAALQWLNQPRLTATLPREITERQVAQLTQVVIEIEQWAQQQLQEPTFRLKHIGEWLKQHALIQMSSMPSSTALENTADTLPAKPGFWGQLLRRPSKEINSEQELGENIRRIIEFLRHKEERVRATTFAWALLWSNMTLPQHDNYVTHVSSPRDSNRVQLQRAYEQKSHETILQLCEEFFLETGGAFWLDLPWYAFHAATALNETLLAERIQQATYHLLQRLPLLIDLRFSEGNPFANDATRSWLLSLSSTQVGVADNASPIFRDADAWLQHAKEMTGSNELPALIQFLQEVPLSSKREQFQRHFAIAKALHAQRQGELAEIVLSQLTEKIDDHRLAEWEPALTLQVWTLAYEMVSGQIKKLPESQRATLLARRQILQAKICTLDLPRGLQLTN